MAFAQAAGPAMSQVLSAAPIVADGSLGTALAETRQDELLVLLVIEITR